MTTSKVKCTTKGKCTKLELNTQRISIYNKDVLKLTKNIPDNYFDGIFSDPPYALNFMGNDWDKAIPPVAVWKELLRTCKPGAYALVFGGTRTHHRLMCNIEDAGWNIKDCISWCYGSGFPKSMDISKALDKAAGAEREVIGIHYRHGGGSEKSGSMSGPLGTSSELPLTAPSTPEAALWDGYGTAIKPAWEIIILCQKPPDGTYANNVFQYGCGGLNIDRCRINQGEPVSGGGANFDAWREGEGRTDRPSRHKVAQVGHNKGRWPANFILSHHDECNDKCHPECPISILDKQSGNVGALAPVKGTEPSSVIKNMYSKRERVAGAFHGDQGGASRFFYQAKAAKSERRSYNTHPCVKPLTLCSYLATLILPPKMDTRRRLLIPFSGSGSEILGAVHAGWDNIVGIELEANYIDIAVRRIKGE